jgi:hypothetical protein
MEIYLVSFKSYLLKANQAQIILQEIFKSSNMHLNQGNNEYVDLNQND